MNDTTTKILIACCHFDAATSTGLCCDYHGSYDFGGIDYEAAAVAAAELLAICTRELREAERHSPEFWRWEDRVKLARRIVRGLAKLDEGQRKFEYLPWSVINANYDLARDIVPDWGYIGENVCAA